MPSESMAEERVKAKAVSLAAAMPRLAATAVTAAFDEEDIGSLMPEAAGGLA